MIRRRSKTVVFAVMAAGAFIGCPAYAQTSRRAQVQTAPAASAPSAAQASSGPTLNETAEFIQQTLATYGEFTLKDFTPNWLNAQKINYSIGQRNGCSLDIVRVDKEEHYTNGGLGKEHEDDYTLTSVYHLALSGIDPGSLTVSDVSTSQFITSSIRHYDICGFAIAMGTNNNAKTLQVAKDGVNETVSSLTIHTSNRDMADGLAKAFTHAVVLCGGKPSAF